MQGARKYVEAIEKLARKVGYGFEQYYHSQCNYRKGNFLFSCGEHARGKTLNIFLLKEMPDLDADSGFIWNTIKNSEISLAVYGVVSGQRGWTETYDYLVKNEIKQVLSSILNEAVRNYDKLLNDEKEKADAVTKEKSVAYSDKVKEFEQFLLNDCKETVTDNATSESVKVPELLSTNPVENAYTILRNVLHNNPDANINDFSIAVEEAIGYLGQALDE